MNTRTRGAKTIYNNFSIIQLVYLIVVALKPTSEQASINNLSFTIIKLPPNHF